MVFPIRRRGVNAGLATCAILFVAACVTGCRRDVPHGDPTTTSASSVTNGATGADANANVVRLVPSQGELSTLLPAEVAKARARNLKPFLELRADWCGPCRQLESSMSDPRMIDAFAGTYLIRLDVDDWKSQQLASMGVDGRSIPVFFALDSTTGKATGRTIDGGAWAENIAVNMAPPLKAFFTK